jgi:hypothetical protein
MKAYDVNGSDVQSGIPVKSQPYPLIALGEGGNKRATWIPLGKRDVESIVKPRMVACPNQGMQEYHYGEDEPSAEQKLCEKCGKHYSPWGAGATTSSYQRRSHPREGMVKNIDVVEDVGVIALNDQATGKPNGKFLIVGPRNGNRILVLWRVSSGYRGGSSISAGEGVRVIASDSAWHSGRGATGETAEMLAILESGQELHAQISGRRVQQTRARLRYDGEKITVQYGDSGMYAAEAEEPQGEYL